MLLLPALLLGLSAAAAPTAAVPAPVRVAVMAFSGVDMGADRLAFDGEHFAQAFRAPGLKVLTAREMGTLLGLERQRQLMGCDAAATACIAELAAALGAEAVVVGDVGHFERSYQVNVKVLSGTGAHLIASRSARVEGEVARLDALSAIGRALAAAVLADRRLPVPAELTRAPEGARPWAWLPLGVGVAAGAGGGVLLALSRGDAAALTGTGPALSPAEADALRDAGKARQTAGVVLLVASGASLLASAGLFLFARDPVVLTVAPGPGGWSLAVGGTLP